MGVTPVVIPVANIEGGFTGTGELSFHADHHWTPYPSSGSFLYTEEVTTKAVRQLGSILTLPMNP